SWSHPHISPSSPARTPRQSRCRVALQPQRAMRSCLLGVVRTCACLLRPSECGAGQSYLWALKCVLTPSYPSDSLGKMALAARTQTFAASRVGSRPAGDEQSEEAEFRASDGTLKV